MKHVKFVIYGCVIGSFMKKAFKKLTFNVQLLTVSTIRLRYVKMNGEEVILRLYPGNISVEEFKHFVLKVAPIVPLPGWTLKEIDYISSAPVAYHGDDWDGIEKCLCAHDIKRLQTEYYNIVVPTELE